MTARPVLHLIAGINGAGKTSFYHYQLARSTPGAEFVNADELAHEKWPGNESEHTEEAARLVAQRRETLLEERRTFVTLQRGQVTRIRDPLPEWVEQAYAGPIAQYRAETAER